MCGKNYKSIDGEREGQILFPVIKQKKYIDIISKHKKTIIEK